MQLITAPPFLDETIERSTQEFDPNIIVLDLSLIESADSGFSVLRRLKRSDFLMNIPVVCSKYVGSDPDDRYRIKALAYGAKVALPKIPFPKAEDFLKYVKLEK